VPYLRLECGVVGKTPTDYKGGKMYKKIRYASSIIFVFYFTYCGHFLGTKCKELGIFGYIITALVWGGGLWTYLKFNAKINRRE